MTATKPATTLTGIIITLSAEPEDLPVRGNALASGDADVDRRAEDAILARSESGDTWAWCNVRVRATWTAPSGTQYHGDAYLGACSYDSEADFRAPGGYYEQMAEEATEALHETLRATIADADAARPEQHYRDAARYEYHGNDEIEIEPDAPVSLSDDDDGAYVQAWVWIPRPTAPITHKTGGAS